jgi:SAM-dependent methyltransferase
MYRAIQLYTFLNHCNDSSLPKEVMDCGAGCPTGYEPPLLRFHEHGYTTHGLEILEERVAVVRRFCAERGIDLDVRQGDMRDLHFPDESMSFVYSYNTIFHMTKADMARAMREIERVLRPEGLCFVNFMSVDDSACGTGEEVGPGEFRQIEAGGEVIHTFHEDEEADVYFAHFTVLHKEKRILDRRWDDGDTVRQAYIDYIARKT